MTQEEKQLLFQVLSAMLPYGLVVNIGDRDLKLDRQHQGIGILYSEDCSGDFNERNNNSAFYITISGCYYGEDIKPYLRPMSSMTMEERCEYDKFVNSNSIFNYQNAVNWVHWLNYNHFDYYGLIPMGLALEATEDMYATK